MKKNILKTALALVFVVGIIVSFNTEAKAFVQEPEETICYNVTESCWFFGCYDVTHCGSCGIVSADHWFEGSICLRAIK